MSPILQYVEMVVEMTMFRDDYIKVHIKTTMSWPYNTICDLFHGIGAKTSRDTQHDTRRLEENQFPGIGY